MPQIRVLLGYQQGHVFSLADRPLVIGRDPKADIVLHPDSAASRRHAEIYPQGTTWRIRDLGSVNGTDLNGRQLKDEPLSDKDEVVVGDNVFVFENKGTEASRIAEAASQAVPSQPRGLANRPEIQRLVLAMSERTKSIEREIGKAIVGQSEIIRDVLIAMISRGHVLLIGMPGLAKTTLVRTISEVIDLKFKRIQLTPDLTPGDITGTVVLQMDEQSTKKEPRFVRGPIFTQVLLAEEINRTPPKTQAALLEAMQDYRVTAAGNTLTLDAPFFVLATQNPLEQESTYPLPEAQLDRFMFSVYMDYPSEKEEETIAKASTAPQEYTLNKVLSTRQILELQAAVRDLPVSDHVIKYAVRLVRSTRPAEQRSPDFIKKYIHCGAGPRAAQYLILGAKARAIIDGRLLVTTDDVRAVARPTLRHRIFTNFSADSEGMDTDKIVKKLVEAVEEPGERDY
jgi:MoxR-like ATPase